MRRIHLITSFFESPYHPNRAPYNEQLFAELSAYFNISIVRPIAWTDIRAASEKRDLKDYYESQWKGIPIRYPTFWYLPKYGVSWRDLFYRFSIKQSINELGASPDLYYTTWAYPDAYSTMKIAQKAGKPYVVRIHGSDVNVLAHMTSLRPKIKQVLENAALVISPSQALKNELSNLGICIKNVQVIYSGVNRDIFKPFPKKLAEEQLNLTQTVPSILYIGNLKVSKGVCDLVLAASEIASQERDFKVYIVGKGEDRRQLEQLIAEHSLESKVELVGPVEHGKLATWINATDVLCLPSYAEGMPNVVLEALSCGTKVVCSNVGGIPEAIKQSAECLVAPGDISALARTLDRALFDDNFQTTANIELKTYEQISAELTESLNSIIEDH